MPTTSASSTRTTGARDEAATPRDPGPEVISEPAVNAGQPPRSSEGPRPDLRGVAAVALTLVLAQYSGIVPPIAGAVGVDLAFVLVGYIVVAGLSVRYAATGRFDVVSYVARGVRRVVPGVTVVLVATAALTVAALPPARWSQMAGDLLAGAAYLTNWRVASARPDGVPAALAQAAEAGPAEHLWPIAVLVQILVLVPVLALLLRRWDLRRITVAAAAVALAAVSLLTAVLLAGRSPGSAAFSTPARAWEVAAGAAVALGAPWLGRLRPSVRNALGMAGLVLLIAPVALTWGEGADAAPAGRAAIGWSVLAVLGASALLAGVTSRAGRGVDRLLCAGPVRDVGSIAVALYLWHWPLLVVASAVLGRLSTPQAALVIGFAVVPAWLTFRIVETPARDATVFRRPRLSAVLAIVATVAVVVAAAAPATRQPTYPVDPDAPGAAVLRDAGADDDGGGTGQGLGGIAATNALSPGELTSVTPSIDDAFDDMPDMYTAGCHQRATDADLLMCAYGDESADRVVALVGDSHAAQWQPGLEAVAVTRGWRLETYTKSSCPMVDVTTAASSGGAYTSCTEWNENLLDHLTGPGGPDVVVASASHANSVFADGRRLSPEDSRPLILDGLRRSWQAILDAGVELTVIGDTPGLEYDVPACLSGKADDADAPDQVDEVSDCVRLRPPRATADVDVDAAEGMEGVNFLDLDAMVCPEAECRAVIGGVMVWRDSHHLTSTYVRSIAPELDEALTDAVSVS